MKKEKPILEVKDGKFVIEHFNRPKGHYMIKYGEYDSWSGGYKSIGETGFYWGVEWTLKLINEYMAALPAPPKER
jgi:hypothetical protein